MNKVKGLLVFAFGVMIGAGGTYIYTKKKYDILIEEEVSSARETYNRLAKELADKNEAEKKKIFSQYTEKVEEYINDAIDDEYEMTPTKEASSYTSFTVDEVVSMMKKPDDISVGSEKIDPNSPYEINASEYGSIEEYDLVSLNYYSNEVLTDERNELIEDPGSLISEKLFNKLQTYEMNGIYTAYARNDTRRCDYEIILTSSDFEEEQ